MTGAAALFAALACAKQPPAAPADLPSKSASLATMAPGGTAPIDAKIVTLEERVDHLPKADNWILLGQAWVQKARETTDPVYYLNADACAQEALKVDPKSAQAVELRVLLRLSNHQFHAAKDLAEETLAQKPDQVLMLGLLSDALTDLGDYDAATAKAQAMMDLKPCLPSYVRASYLQWLHGDEPGALNSIRLAIDSGDPKEPEAVAWVLVQAALLFWQAGDVAGADAGFDKALETFADFPPALAGKGRVALAKGDPKGALVFLQKSLALSPLLSTAWLLADAQRALGDAAGSAATEALLQKNAAADPRTYAQYLAVHNQQPELALKRATDERQTRDDIYTEDAIAWANYRKGNLPAARAASDRALRLGTPDASLWYHAGAIRLAQGQKTDGLAWVRKALARNPHFDETGRAEALSLVK